MRERERKKKKKKREREREREREPPNAKGTPKYCSHADGIS